MLKCALFSCNGLGDGIINLVLANNLKMNGHQIDFFHRGSLIELKHWFPYVNIIKQEVLESEIYLIFLNYDKVFVAFDKESIFTNRLIKIGKDNFSEKIIVLSPSASSNINGQPYFSDCMFDKMVPMAENLKIFSKDILKLSKVTNVNDMTFPRVVKANTNLHFRRHINRVVIHATSAKKGRNWSLKKYQKLASLLKKNGYMPAFISFEKDKEYFSKEANVNFFSNLDELASFIYESGYFIGNDSGVGHLAASLKIPVLTIFRNFRLFKLWLPVGDKVIGIYPSRTIPNLRFLRIRDKYWQKFVSVKMVFSKFLELKKF